MSVRGLAQSMVIEPDGSEVVTAASFGASSLFVDDVTDFSEQSELSVNDQVITYTTVDEDTGELTLATPLAAAAAVGDRVYVLAGGQILSRYTLMVSVDDEGDPIPVTIAFADRDLWPEAEEYDDPVPVVLSDDLDSIVDVPGRTPIREMQTPTAVQSMTVDGDLTAGGVTVTDGSVDVEVGPYASDGAPGMRVVNGAKSGRVKLDPVSGILELVADVDNADTTVWVGSAGLDPADFVVFGRSKFLKRVDVTAAVHGTDIYVDSVPTTGSVANCRMAGDGQLLQSTSSKRYKKDIRDAEVDVDAVLSLQPRSWVSLSPADDPDRRYLGLVAEEVDAAGVTELVTYDHEGRPNAVEYPLLGPMLLAVVQKQQAQIEALTARVAALEAAPSTRSARSSKESR